MLNRQQFMVLLSGLGLSFALSAATTEISGVKVDDSVELQGQKLVLNGVGIRHKAVFKVYVASLYLTKKAATTDEVLASSGNKRISATMLRDIDASELGKLFTRGIEDNMPKNEFSKLIPPIMRMSQVFSDYKQLKTGDSFTIDFVAGTGTILSIRGKPVTEPFKEPEFFNALARIWLGNNPADWKLKEALLGKT